ncbi:hypothetical protein KR038_007900, partial [Drosophila bunnanda]
QSPDPIPATNALPREMEHYADLEEDDEEKADPESWTLSEAETRELEDIKKVFLTFENDGLGTTGLEKHTIELVVGAKAFKDRPYPMSPVKQKVVEDEVDKMLALGVIEESKSPWSNRTTVVSKPGKDRFCLDARKLNDVTVKDADPLPSIDGILSRIDQTHFISSRGDTPDPRPFAQITILGQQLTGLLDTGASVSLLGKGSRQLVYALGVPVQRYFPVVRTAAGEDRSIIGRIKVPVKYKGRVEYILFYLCPYLEQAANLGVDFWRTFELAPAVVGNCPVQGVKVEEIHAREMEHYADQEEDDEEKADSESWTVSEAETRKLEDIKKVFLTFENDGLGTTGLEKHTIELVAGAKVFKDRPYPMSPVKQKVVEDEVDKMLALGVIEESKSPWSNRTTVVSKPGNDRFCLDARKLNDVTVKDAYPLPSINGIL